MLWGRGVPRVLMPSPATGQGPSLTELAPIRLPNTDMNLPQPPGPSSWSPTSSPFGPGSPMGLHPNSPQDSAHRPQAALVAKSLSWHQALLLPAHCPPPTPAQLPREQEPSLPSPTHSADPAQALHAVLGEGKEPEEGEGGGGDWPDQDRLGGRQAAGWEGGAC